MWKEKIRETEQGRENEWELEDERGWKLQGVGN